MHIITRLLVKADIIALSDQRLSRWAKQKKITHLIYALKHAHYTQRIYAATLLSKFEQPKVSKALLEALEDSMSYVSLEAIATLEKFELSLEEQAKVSNKKAYWEATLPELIKQRAKIKGSIAGFYDSNIPSPDGFINNDNAGCYGPM